MRMLSDIRLLGPAQVESQSSDVPGAGRGPIVSKPPRLRKKVVTARDASLTPAKDSAHRAAFRPHRSEPRGIAREAFRFDRSAMSKKDDPHPRDRTSSRTRRNDGSHP